MNSRHATSGSGSIDVSPSMKRPNILYITHRVPYPPNRGDRIRSYHTLRYLAERATVDLACLSDEPVEAATLDVLKSLCRRVAIAPLSRSSRWLRASLSLARGRSATERLFYSPSLYRTLAEWSHETSYDSVLAFCSSMAPYLSAGRLPEVPLFVDLVDVDSQKWFDYAERAKLPLRWLFQLEGRRVQRLEQYLAERSKAMFVVSEDEASLLRKSVQGCNIQAIQNGVDLEYFAPTRSDNTSTGADCVFVGALDYRANIDGVTWFCQHVWPQIRAIHPTATLQLVGRRPGPNINHLALVPGIEVVADVPDVRPYLHSAKVVIAPLRIARGIQNKVLEALAAGAPVVASPQALVGLETVEGEHAYVAETPQQWVHAIDLLLNDREEGSRLSRAGQEFVSEHHRWERCLEPLGRFLHCDDSSPWRELAQSGGRLNAPPMIAKLN